VSKSELKLLEGADRYVEHLVSAGAVPHYVRKGARGWLKGFGVYYDLYRSYVEPCLDSAGVVGQDRSFWVAWSYKLFKKIEGAPTMAVLPAERYIEYLRAATREALKLARVVNAQVAECISRELDIIAPARAERAGERKYETSQDTVEELETLFDRSAWEKVRPILLADSYSPHGKVVKGVTKFLARNPNIDLVALKAMAGHAHRWGRHAAVMRVVSSVLNKYSDRAPMHYRVKYYAFANEVAKLIFGRKGNLETINTIKAKYLARGADEEILNNILATVLQFGRLGLVV